MNTGKNSSTIMVKTSMSKEMKKFGHPNIQKDVNQIQ